MKILNYLVVISCLVFFSCTSNEKKGETEINTNTNIAPKTEALLLLAGGNTYWISFDPEPKLLKTLDYLLIPYGNDWRYYKNIIATAKKACVSSYDPKYTGDCTYTITGVAKGNSFVALQKDYTTFYKVYMDEARKKVACGESSDYWYGLLDYVCKDFYSESYGYGGGVCLEEGGGYDWNGRRAIAHKNGEELKAIDVLGADVAKTTEKAMEKVVEDYAYMDGDSAYGLFKEKSKAEDFTLSLSREYGLFNLAIESTQMIGELDGESIQFKQGLVPSKLIEGNVEENGFGGDYFSELRKQFKVDDIISTPDKKYLITKVFDSEIEKMQIEVLDYETKKSKLKIESNTKSRSDIQGVFWANKGEKENWNKYIDRQVLLSPENENKIIYYAWVDKLNLRDKPNLNAKVVGQLNENQKVYFKGNVSKNKEELEIRGIKFNNHFLEVETLDGQLKGWVYAGALKDSNDQNRTPDYFKFIK